MEFVTIVIDLPKDVEEMLYQLANHNDMDIEDYVKELIMKEHFISAPYFEEVE